MQEEVVGDKYRHLKCNLVGWILTRNH